MKILFDTNVIISGFVSQGYSFEVIKDAANKHEIYYSEYLLKETQRILSTKFPLSQDVINAIICTVKEQFFKGETANNIKAVSRDPKDNQVLADAVINNIDIIITGDKDLLEIENYKGIKIIMPRDYWKI